MMLLRSMRLSGLYHVSKMIQWMCRAFAVIIKLLHLFVWHVNVVHIYSVNLCPVCIFISLAGSSIHINWSKCCLCVCVCLWMLTRVAQIITTAHNLACADPLMNSDHSPNVTWPKTRSVWPTLGSKSLAKKWTWMGMLQLAECQSMGCLFCITVLVFIWYFIVITFTEILQDKCCHARCILFVLAIK